MSIARATNSSYTVTNASHANAGHYTVIVSNVVATVTSAPPARLPPSNPPPPSRRSQPTRRFFWARKRPWRSRWLESTARPTRSSISGYTGNYATNTALPKATNAALAFPAAQCTNHGSYCVIITNGYGAATRTRGHAHRRGHQPAGGDHPAPANNVTTNAGMVTVSGTAKDNLWSDQVRVKVNTNNYQAAATAQPLDQWPDIAGAGNQPHHRPEPGPGRATNLPAQTSRLLQDPFHPDGADQRGTGK